MRYNELRDYAAIGLFKYMANTFKYMANTFVQSDINKFGKAKYESLCKAIIYFLKITYPSITIFQILDQ